MSGDKVQKRMLYGEAGVPHDWIVDVDTRTLEAFTLESGRWILSGSYDEESTAAIPPFDSVALDVGRLFLPRA